MTKPRIVEKLEEVKAQQEEAIAHVENKSNPHNVTKAQIGLGDVDNTKDANKPVSTATKAELDKKINKSEKGVANGVASLGEDGKIPVTQLDMSKITIDTSSFATTANLDAHKNSSDIHVTLSQKNKWDTTSTNFTSHSSDLVKHITSAERTKWNSNVTDFTAHAGNASMHFTGNDRYNLELTYDHLFDTVSHVTQEDKNFWDSAGSHAGDWSVHISGAERQALDGVTSHINDNSKHVSTSERATWNGKQNHIRKPLISPASSASSFADEYNPIVVMSENITTATGMLWRDSLGISGSGYLTLITTASSSGEYTQHAYVIGSSNILIVHASRYSYSTSWSAWKVHIDYLETVEVAKTQANSRVNTVSLAIGGALQSGSPDGFSVGRNASGYSDEAVAIGYMSTAYSKKSVSIGSSASAGISTSIGTGATAIGNEAHAYRDYSIAIGGNANAGAINSAVGSYSTAIGYGTVAYSDYSTAIGYGAGTYSSNELALGYGSTTVRIGGALSVSGYKNFEIPHPKPEKKHTHVIRHGAVESPTAGDTLYRYNITAVEDDEKVIIDLPDYFIHLNKDVDIWVNGKNHFGRGFGEIVGEQLIITCEKAGSYNVLAIGTRNDDNVQDWVIKGVEKEIGEDWIGETSIFEVDEFIEISEIKEIM